jgi:MFS family permease
MAPSFLLSPPYLFNSANLGVYFVSSFAGIVIAYPIAGPLTDILSRAITRFRNGVHYPENRLPALIVAFLICPPGIILWGYIFAENGSYITSAVGQAMQVAAMVLVPSVVLSVVVDAYPKEGSEAMVLINAGKNLIAFGITVSTMTWITNVRLVKMVWEMAAVQWAVLLFAIPLLIWGSWLRNKTFWIV